MSVSQSEQVVGDSFLAVTELAHDDVAPEQIKRMCDRYYWASSYCAGKDVVEVACGTGIGLGYLARFAKNLEAGDISPEMIRRAKSYYGDRVKLQVLDAESLPFPDQSKDVIILFEAIYYLPDVPRFLTECRRVLRAGGYLLLATSNKDLFDFNPSPYSHRYFGTVELREILEEHGFSVRCFGNTPLGTVSIRQRVMRPVKCFAVKFNLIPKTMNGKKLLKKLVFGGLVPMPAEVDDKYQPLDPPTPLSLERPDRDHKVIFCEAKVRPLN